MSTRANIKMVEGKSTLWFYRHSDGYPEGAMPLLEKFMDLIKEGKIRNNISQSSGWLIMLGAEEYGQDLEKMRKGEDKYSGWKVGSIEPTTGQHGDIEFLYTIDLVKETIKVKGIDKGLIYNYDL